MQKGQFTNQMYDVLESGPERARVRVILAHGGGAAMTSPFMARMGEMLARRDIAVARFEFAYMAARRNGGKRRPPPRAELLCPEYRQAVESIAARLAPGQRLLIGGKSMGGRVASMIADELLGAGSIAGLVCLGYPFHPPAKPEQLRTAHLLELRTPALICQGTRDEFGTREEVALYPLSPQIEFLWLEDGDHDLKPRKSVSGFSAADHLKTMARRTRGWIEGLLDGSQGFGLSGIGERPRD